jgi:hypothetical protein
MLAYGLFLARLIARVANSKATRIIMEHSGALFDKDEATHNVATLNCH